MPPTDTNCAIFAMHITNLGSVFPPSGVPNRVHPHKERTLASTRKLDPGAVGRRAAVGAMAGRGLGFQYMTTSLIKDGSQKFGLQEAIHTREGIVRGFFHRENRILLRKSQILDLDTILYSMYYVKKSLKNRTF